MPHAAARLAVCDSASPLEMEITPYVVELVLSTDSPSLITTNDLLPHDTSCSSQYSLCRMVDFSHEVLHKILQVTSVRFQAAKHTNETAQPRFLNFVDCLETVS